MRCKLRSVGGIGEHGSSLFIVIFILLLLSMLGSILISASGNNLMIAKNQRNEAEATYLGEAGIEFVLFWFNNPDKFTEGDYFKNNYTERPQDFFKKRLVDKNGVPTFASDGISQFTGTQDRPDLEYELPSNNKQLAYLFDSIRKLGVIKSIKVYSPKREGMICTVESIGRTNSGIIRSVIMELKGSPLPPMTAPLQSGSEDINMVPIKVHWGDIKILGNGNLGDDLAMIPKKNQIPTPDGSSYAMASREDRWLDIYAGRQVVNPSQKGCIDCKEPYLDLGHDNIHQLQSPAFSPDRWSYNDLKSYAKEYGRYFSTDSYGNLYQDGILGQANKKSLDEIAASIYPGDSRGFVFVDTMDGNPPNESNIPTLRINKNYSEGIFYINANLTIGNMEEGFPIDAKTPPWEGKIDEETRMPVRLSDINLNGAIYSTGAVVISGRFNVFGGIYSEKGFPDAGGLEVWYNHDMMTGHIKGNPAVVPVKGSWREGQ